MPFLTRLPRFPVVVGMFFGSLTLLEGKGIRDAQQRIEDAYVPTLVRNWSVSPTASFLVC